MANWHATPEPPDPVHFDVAAYALGVLDPGDIESCEQHLAECPGCATELEQLLPVSNLLADVEPSVLGEFEDPAMLERLTCAVRADRRRSRRRRRLLAGTTSLAAVVAVGLALLVEVDWLDRSLGPSGALPSAPVSTPSAPGTGPPGFGGPDLGEGERFSSTDPTTGVHADVVLTSRDWGTLVSFGVSSLTGPLECQLLLVYTDGSAEVAGSWRVPVEGYGTEAQPNPLLLQASVAADRAQLTELRINALSPEGSADTLVSVPL